MEGLIENIKTRIYLGGADVIIFIGVVSVMALLVLYRIIYAGTGERLNTPRAVGAAALLGALLVLPLPIMLLFRPGVSAREAVGGIIYRNECAVCHGEQGNRLPGVSLGSQDYLQQLGDAGIKRAIEEGKGLMPAWGRSHEGPLSDEQIDMVINFLKSEARAGEVPATPKAATASASPSGSPSADAGRQLFASNCATCHGANGGRIPAVKLTSKAFVDARDDAALAAVISNGKGGMPAFSVAKEGSLTDVDIQSLVAFLRTLPTEP